MNTRTRHGPMLVRHVRSETSWVGIACAVALASAAACASESSPLEGPAATTTITVDVAMTGNAVDADGFTVTIADTSLTFTGGAQKQITVKPGTYTAQISGLADNCAADSTTTTVSANLPAVLTFTVECDGGFAYSTENGTSSVAYYVGEDGRTVQLATAEEQARVYEWSPDGQVAIVQSFGTGSFPYNIVHLDGSPGRPLSSVTSASYYSAHISPNGSTIVYDRYTRSAGYQIRLTDVAGTFDRPLMADSTAGYFDTAPAWSPDGTQIVFGTDRFTPSDVNQAFAVMNADGSDMHPIGDLVGGVGSTVAWSPDGQSIAAIVGPASSTSGTEALDIFPAGGGSVAEAWRSDTAVRDFKWSPDGARLAVELLPNIGPTRVMLINRDGTSPVPLVSSLVYTLNPSWSRDGSRILFSAQNFDGSFWIYVCHPDGSHLHPVVRGSTFAMYPLWSPTAAPGAKDK